MKIQTSIIVSLTFLISQTTQAQDIMAPRGEVEEYPAKTWHSPSLDFMAANWQEAKLIEAEKKWEELHKLGQSTGMMVVHKGFVIREFGDCATPVPCHSMRKSFLSAVFGAWIHDSGTDLDKLLETKISDIPLSEKGGIPEVYQAATIQQMLKSSSGSPLAAEYESSAFFGRRSKEPALPGKRWAYSNWDFNALGTTFQKKSGMNLFQAFDDLIAKPIGMEDFDKDEDTMNYPRQGAPTKSLHPAYLFKLSARDRARFGLLYLSGGMWRSDRIIDKTWFEKSITDTIPTEDQGLDYGYMWWIGVGGHRKYPFPGDRTYSARGNGGQFIIVIPSRDLVIVNARDTGERRNVTDFNDVLFNDVFHRIANAQIRKTPNRVPVTD